ncbi:hypothetical protein Tco_1007125 [Tanacetum coccineum]
MKIVSLTVGTDPTVRLRREMGQIGSLVVGKVPAVTVMLGRVCLVTVTELGVCWILSRLLTLGRVPGGGAGGSSSVAATEILAPTERGQEDVVTPPDGAWTE